MGIDFVACGTAVDGVTGVLVDDFEGSGFGDVEVFEPWFLDGAFLDDEACAKGVFFADGNGVSFFYEERILLSVDGGIDSQGEDMLMVSREDLIVNDGTVGTALFVHGFVDGLSGQDSSCTYFEMDICCLAELPCLDVNGLLWGDSTKMYS